VENSHPRRASNHHASGAQRSGRWPHGARRRRPPASTAPRLASVVQVASRSDPSVGEGHCPHPQIGCAAYAGRICLVDVAKRTIGGDEVVVAEPNIVLLRPVGVPPSNHQFGRESGIAADPAADGPARARRRWRGESSPDGGTTWVCPAWSSGRGSPRRDTRRYCRTAAGGRRHPWPLRSRGAQSRRAPWACPAVGGTARGRVGLDRRSGAPNAGRIDEHLAPPPDYFTVSPRLRRDLLGPVWCSGAPAGTGPRCHLRDHYSRARTADGRRR
jgi:hypothetical protein